MVVGFDAAEPHIVLDLAAKGDLPHVQSLVDRGVRAEIVNPPGFFVSASWPSMFTGLSPAHHGRFSGLQLHPGTYAFDQFVASEVAAEPFWAVLGREGRRCAVIDVPHTEPISGLNGLQLCDWGTHDGPHVFRTSPPELATAVIDRFGRYPAQPCSAYARRGALGELQRDLVAAISRKTDLAEDVLDEEDWDFFMVVFGEAHDVGHVCWHLHDTNHPQYDRSVTELIGDPVVSIYQSLDATLGRLLAKVGDDVTVFLLLSHGMGPNYQARSVLDKVLLRLDNVLGDVPRFMEARMVLRRAQRGVARRVRDRLGVPQPTRQDVLDPRRRFFQLPNHDACGAIRFNLAGREPAGRVHPGREYEELCATLEEELLALVNLETGQPVVRQVCRTAEHYDGPAVARMPDLWVEWNREVPIRSIGSPTIGRIDCTLSGLSTGDHRPGGLLVGKGPSIAAGQLLGPIEGVQIAPTICGLLDCDLPGSEARPVALTSDVPN